MTNEIDDYINKFDSNAQKILNKIRAIGKELAPNANEKIAYRIPSFYLKSPFFHYAAFKNHYSIYPPIKGNAQLNPKIEKYRNPKGNLIIKYNNNIDDNTLYEILNQRLKEYNQAI